MKVQVEGDENEIEIRVGDKLYTGDLSSMSEDDTGPEIWEIDGLIIETEQILCLGDLEDLATEFLEQRKIDFDSIEVTSESFDE